MSRFLFSITFLFQISMLVAQTFVEIGNTYPVSVDGNKYVVNGFITFDKLTDGGDLRQHVIMDGGKRMSETSRRDKRPKR